MKEEKYSSSIKRRCHGLPLIIRAVNSIIFVIDFDYAAFREKCPGFRRISYTKSMLNCKNVSYNSYNSTFSFFSTMYFFFNADDSFIFRDDLSLSDMRSGRVHHSFKRFGLFAFRA